MPYLSVGTNFHDRFVYESSADDMVEWTIRLTALGQAIPAAVAAAQEVGFNLEKAAVMCRAQWD